MKLLYIGETLHRVEIPPYDTIPDKKTVKKKNITRWAVPDSQIVIGLSTEGSSPIRKADKIRRSSHKFYLALLDKPP
ncbi:MAG: hypothetical protein ACP5U1_03510 [Desulfomonilaceae bacterium]